MAGMKKPNNHAEPTKVEHLKKDTMEEFFVKVMILFTKTICIIFDVLKKGSGNIFLIFTHSSDR